MTREKLLTVRNLTRTFKSQTKALKAIDDISFEIYRGETLGVVGESGCGKTTLGRCLAGLLKPDSGEIVSSVSHLHTQMIFQDPYDSVDPYWTVEKIIAEGIRNNSTAAELMAKVGLTDAEKNSFPHELSGGQLQRVGIARALGNEPDFIVCDEPVSALDVSYQSKIITLLEDLQQQDQLTYLFISHDLAVVRHISDRIMIMYRGQIMEIGEAGDIVNDPVHPYTEFLLSALPSPFAKKEEFAVREGQEISYGCPFAPRCPWCTEKCLQERPPLKPAGNDHLAACWEKVK